VRLLAEALHAVDPAVHGLRGVVGPEAAPAPASRVGVGGPG